MGVVIIYVLAKFREQFYKVQMMINYSSTWLASNSILMVVNLFMAIALKIIILLIGLKITNIIQSGEFKIDPKKSKILTHIFKGPYQIHEFKNFNLLWAIPICILTIPVLSFVFYSYIYIVKISMTNYFFGSTNPIK